MYILEIYIYMIVKLECVHLLAGNKRICDQLVDNKMTIRYNKYQDLAKHLVQTN